MVVHISRGRVDPERVGEAEELLGHAVAEMVFEACAGGHVYDRGVDDSECRWARVLVYEPPHRLVIIRDLSLQGQLETDHEKTSEVEVRFIARGANRTRVELEHRNLDRHGEGWEQMRDAVGSPGGWPAGMRPLAERVEMGTPVTLTTTNQGEAPCTPS